MTDKKIIENPVKSYGSWKNICIALLVVIVIFLIFAAIFEFWPFKKNDVQEDTPTSTPTDTPTTTPSTDTIYEYNSNPEDETNYLPLDNLGIGVNSNSEYMNLGIHIQPETSSPSVHTYE